jgi:hypothetical protein
MWHTMSWISYSLPRVDDVAALLQPQTQHEQPLRLGATVVNQLSATAQHVLVLQHGLTYVLRLLISQASCE